MKKIIISAFAMAFALTSFAQKADSTKTTIKLRGNAPSGTAQPLIVIDGNKQYVRGTGTLKEIDPNDIESVTILKDSSAVAVYGAEGFAGVVEVKTKSGKIRSSQISQDNNIVPDFKGKVASFTIHPVAGSVKNIEGSNFSITKNGIKLKNGTAEPLYIVDGKETIDGKNIDPESIESITVLKDGASQKLYGDKAVNGVILIKTKNAQALPKKN